MKVSVTQAHIDAANKLLNDTNTYYSRCASCPVALACSEALGFNVTVTGTDVHREVPDEGSYYWTLPVFVTAAICSYDVNKGMAPLEFELGEPSFFPSYGEQDWTVYCPEDDYSPGSF